MARKLLLALALVALLASAQAGGEKRKKYHRRNRWKSASPPPTTTFSVPCETSPPTASMYSPPCETYSPPDVSTQSPCAPPTAGYEMPPPCETVDSPPVSVSSPPPGCPQDSPPVGASSPPPGCPQDSPPPSCPSPSPSPLPPSPKPPSPSPPPPPPPKATYPSGFPWCECNATTNSTLYKLAYTGATPVADSYTRYCFALTATIPPSGSTGPCTSFDLRKIEFSVDGTCKKIKNLTFGKDTLAVSTSRGPTGLTAFKVTRPQAAPLGTLAALAATTTPVCFNLPNVCSLTRFCRGPYCIASFFNPSSTCCPLTSIAY